MFRFSSPHPALRASLSRSRAVQNVLAPLRGAWSLDICNSGKRLKRVPLPPGEGAAKRRVRAGMRNVFDQPALTRPFLDARPIGLALRAGHPLPEGEGLAPRQLDSHFACVTSAGTKSKIQDVKLNALEQSIREMSKLQSPSGRGTSPVARTLSPRQSVMIAVGV